jgi:hypothetical protein
MAAPRKENKYLNNNPVTVYVTDDFLTWLQKEARLNGTSIGGVLKTLGYEKAKKQELEARLTNKLQD